MGDEFVDDASGDFGSYDPYNGTQFSDEDLAGASNTIGMMPQTEYGESMWGQPDMSGGEFDFSAGLGSDYDMDTIPTITGGSGKPFVFALDLHYQATNITTKNKAPNFYA